MRIAAGQHMPRGIARLRLSGPTLARIASLATFFVLWEVYARPQSRLIVAPFSEVVATLVNLVGQPEFRDAYAETMKPFVLGLGLAIIIGIPAGLLIGVSRGLRAFVLPYVNLVNAVPMVAFVPLVVIALGIGLTARVAVVFLFAISDVVLTTSSGVRYVSGDLVQMARSFGASRLFTLTRIVLPAALPGVMAGIRLGTGRAIVGMVAAELLLVSVGLGSLISRYRGLFETASLYAAVLVLALTGIVLLEIVRRIERRVLHWQRAGASER
jgi:ABC-type nitrate/sulfonate/bicarbonate transport system permease component